MQCSKNGTFHIFGSFWLFSVFCWQVLASKLIALPTIFDLSKCTKIVVRRGSATAQLRSNSDHVFLGIAESHIVALPYRKVF
jgi:hypothetical protein